MAIPKLLCGNTYRHTLTFHDFDNESGEPILIDPQVIKFIVWQPAEGTWSKVEELILNNTHRLSVGKYRFLHTPTQEGTFVYEWNGEIDGLPSIAREKAYVSMLS